MTGLNDGDRLDQQQTISQKPQRVVLLLLFSEMQPATVTVVSQNPVDTHLNLYCLAQFIHPIFYTFLKLSTPLICAEHPLSTIES